MIDFEPAIRSPSLSGLPLSNYGTDAQRNELLPGFTAAHFVPGALALVEPKANDIYEDAQQIKQLIVARRILDYPSSMLR